MFGEYEDYCKHDHVRAYCCECRVDRERIEAQKVHEASVAKQQTKLKLLDRSNIVERKVN
jgi:hypothetical protein